MAKPILIGIAGCSGSGKTWLANKILERFTHQSSLLSIDWYYKDLSQLPHDIASQTNFDHPDSIEKQLLIKDLQTLSRGGPILAPIYEFATYSRIPDAYHSIAPTPLIIVEGIFALHFSELTELFVERIFVDTPFDLCFQRRLERDQSERGYSEAIIRSMWERTVTGSYRDIVKPSSSTASRLWKSEEDSAFVNRLLADLEAYLAKNGNALP
ncbi:MAG: uridine kinase [Verrucomicrobiota bacterium]